jgi:predicted DCC family thiol-disulfide oxidoreductase YuxK
MGADAPRHLVLYDGVCGFCDRAVRFALTRDRRGLLRFAPLQGGTAASLRASHPEIPAEAETFVYVEGAPGAQRVYLRSEAALRVLARLDPPWRWLAWLRVLPRPLRDAAYRGFARLRYRLFGRLDACRLPAPAERERFLA